MAAAAGTLQHTKPASARNLAHFFACCSTDIISHTCLKELPPTSKQASNKTISNTKKSWCFVILKSFQNLSSILVKKVECATFSVFQLIIIKIFKRAQILGRILTSNSIITFFINFTSNKSFTNSCTGSVSLHGMIQFAASNTMSSSSSSSC